MEPINRPLIVDWLLIVAAAAISAEHVHGGEIKEPIPRKTMDQLLEEQFLPVATKKLTPVEASPTPQSEVDRVIALLPKPKVGFVEFGCGSDARWCVAAVRKWGCRATGIEIDPTRAASARQYVSNNGLGHLITIVDGDATTVDVQGDVGSAYLYQQTLDKLKPRIEKLSAFASYMHQPPPLIGMTGTKNGDTWIYTRPVQVVHQPRAAVWNGVQYSGPLCNSPSCQMCASIRSQLAVNASPIVTTQSTGHWVKRCNGRQCWYEWVPN